MMEESGMQPKIFVTIPMVDAGADTGRVAGG